MTPCPRDGCDGRIEGGELPACHRCKTVWFREIGDWTFEERP